MAHPLRALIGRRFENLSEKALRPPAGQRMDFAGDRQGERANSGASARIAWQQRRLRMGFLQVFANRQRLGDQAAVVFERRDDTLRIYRLIGWAAGFATRQVDGNIFVIESF
jgi:hypothetical protein